MSNGGARVYLGRDGQATHAGYWSDRPDVDATTRRRLRDLELLADERRNVDERTRLVVGELRVAGCSWTLIGDRLGISRSAAQKRFGPDALL